MHEGVMKAWLESSHLNGGNVAYVEELYEAYLDDATSGQKNGEKCSNNYQK